QQQQHVNGATASRQHDGEEIEKCRHDNFQIPKKFSATQVREEKIQRNISGKTIQTSRYDRRLNNMRHQGTHDDCTIDGDAPTIDDDVTLRQEKSSGRLVHTSSGAHGPIQD
ncbi:unnamed protein product, partial [Aphanomyces euteiches]